MMDRDRITRTGARAPGVERQWLLERWCADVLRSPRHCAGTRRDNNLRTKGGGKPHDAKTSRYSGRPRLRYRPWSRTGENPPYGILGGTVETSASCEARYAPPSHPTRAIAPLDREGSSRARAEGRG